MTFSPQLEFAQRYASDDVDLHMVAAASVTVPPDKTQEAQLSPRAARRAMSVKTLLDVAQMFVELYLYFACIRRMTFKVIQGHWKWHECIYVSVCLSRVISFILPLLLCM